MKKRCRIAISVFVTISSFCDQVRVKMSAGNAHIGKLAPDFTAKAVMPDGQFRDLKLSDYRGTVVVQRGNAHWHVWRPEWMRPCAIIHALSIADGLTLFSPLCCRKICGLFLLPTGLHLCVPHWNNRIQRCSGRFQENWLRGHCSLRWLALLPLCLVVMWCFFETLKVKCD